MFVVRSRCQHVWNTRNLSPILTRDLNFWNCGFLSQGRFYHPCLTHKDVPQDTLHHPCNMPFTPSTFLNKIYWSVVDLQCCINFFCTKKWLSSMYICMLMYMYIDKYTLIYSYFPLEMITLSEVSQTKTNITWCHLYVESNIKHKPSFKL